MRIFGKFIGTVLAGSALLPAQQFVAAEQAVIVHLPLPSWTNDKIFDSLETLEKNLIRVISTERLGEFDGNEVGEGELVLYMYGPDADKLFRGVEAILRMTDLTKAGKVTVRYGGPGGTSREIDLAAR